jgi:peptide/nickel transport system permease protein
LAPPQRIHFIDIDENGKKRIKPHVYDYMVEIDLKMARKIFLPDESKKNYIRFLGKSAPYKLMGFIPMERRILTARDSDLPFFILGSDNQGEISTPA